METVSSASFMHKTARAVKARGQTVAFVPTMGALHEGHLHVVRRARALGEVVVVSIFVNPTQFGPKEDLAKYPRDLENDRRLLEPLSVNYLFTPEAKEIYPGGFRTYVQVEDWENRLCGASRPGHFRGVATVVAKLFQIVLPDFALFGQKDAQQALLIQRMVHDLNFDVEIITCPIVREPDGLAMSSRNRYLNSEERRAATVLHQSLAQAQAAIKKGDRSATRLKAMMQEAFNREPLARVDYIEMVNPETLDSVDQVTEGTLIALAAFVGSTRLIDNWVVEFS